MAATNSTEHYRYESTEFDYEGCVVCDSQGDTLGWPCPTVAREQAEAMPVFYDPKVTSHES